MDPLYLIPLFPIFFIAQWSFIMWILSLGGWARLGDQYGDDYLLQGPLIRSVSLRVGWVNYNSVVSMVVGRKKLGLRVMRLFKIRHKNLAIPYKDLKVEPTKYAFRAAVAMTFRDCPGVRIKMVETHFVRLLDEMAREKIDIMPEWKDIFNHS